MMISVKEAATLVGGKIIGDDNSSFNGIAKIEEAQKGEMSFLYRHQYFKFLKTTNASVLLASEDAPKDRNDITYIVVENPNLAFQKIISKYFDKRTKLGGIDSTAFISESAALGENVTLGKNVVISENCKIGSNTTIFHNSVILDDTVIGEDVIIYPNVTVREGTTIGDRVIIHPGVVVGSDGFGFSPNEKGELNKIPQIGNVNIEDDVEIGSNTTIDRAALGTTVIRKGAKIDNLVQIAHNVEIGEWTAISAQTGISGSTKVGAHCIFGGQVGLADHLEVTDNVMIGAQSGVPKSITKPGKYFGFPIKELGAALRTEGHIRNLPNYAKKIKELEKKLKELTEKLTKSEET